MSPEVIVDISPDRYADCLEVLRTGFGTTTAEFGITADNTPSNPAFWDIEQVAAVVDRGFDGFATEHDGRFTGCAFSGPSRHQGQWSLRHLAVRPTERHRGLGAALVAEAARRGRQNGAERLRIGVVGENRQLAAWYHRLGFVTVEAGLRFPGVVFSVDHLELAL